MAFIILIGGFADSIDSWKVPSARVSFVTAAEETVAAARPDRPKHTTGYESWYKEMSKPQTPNLKPQTLNQS